MRSYYRMIIMLTALLGVALVGIGSPRVASAQVHCIDCADVNAPSVGISPANGTYGGPGMSYTITVTINWCDDHSLDAASREIDFNGQSVTTSFSYVVSAKTGCGSHATSVGSVTLNPGPNTVTGYICDTSSNCNAGSGSFTGQIIYSVAISPPAAAVSLRPNADTTQGFTVTNGGNAQATVSISALCSGTVLATGCSVAPTSLSLGVGQTAAVTASFRTGASGGTTGVVSVIALTGGVSDTGLVNVNVPAEYAVAVTPRDSVVVVPPSSSSSRVFTVTSHSNLTSTFAFTANCSGDLIVAGSCSTSPASASLAPGGASNVTVSFQTGSAGASAIILHALNTAPAGSLPQANDSGWVAVSLTTPLAAVTLAGATPGTTVEKSACLHFAIRPSVGSECGVLRVTHALPGIRTLNKARVPTLVYYYDQAASPQVIGVNVARIGASTPDSVRAILYQRSAGAYVELQRRVFGGGAWSGAAPQRVAMTMADVSGLPSRIVPYRIQVDFKMPGQAWASAAPPADGEVAIIRRELGAGWHLAGVEGLYLQPDSSVLWVGGDGSARKYVARGVTGTNRVFTAPSVDRPDTLLQSTTDKMYTRRAENGLRIVFDTVGLHRQTINRIGQITTFGYLAGTRKLDTITVAPTSAGLRYLFNYSSNGTLTSITAPGASGVRTTTITPSAVAGVLARITDPDSSHVDFEYSTSMGGGQLMNAYTDRRGTRTTLTAESAAPTLGIDSTHSGAQVIAHTFRTNVSVGAASGASPVPVDSAYFRYDGPRSDVVDIARIWVNGLGAPTVIAGPVGDTTRIVYADARFPGLATRVTRPNGVVAASGYDARGHIVVDTTYSPFGDGRNAITRYGWDPIWDAVTCVISPTGIITETQYDPSYGYVTWTQTGGSSHRRTFSYYTPSSGVAAGLAKSMSLPTDSLDKHDEYRYDATLGNLRMYRTPMGFTTLSYADAIGRDTMTITPIRADTVDSAMVVQTGQRVRVHYDVANRIREQWSENGPLLALPDTFRIRAETIQVQTDYDVAGSPTAVRRRSLPDSNNIGWISDGWLYDGFGRDTASPRLRKHFDVAGNVVWTSHGDSSLYDAGGRLTRHFLPSIAWLARDSTWGMAEATGAAADTEIFTYGREGELLAADNRYARIRRGYYPNGALRGDTAFYQDYMLGGTYSQMTPITHKYDLDGRPDTLQHTLVGSGIVKYDYDAATGALSKVTDPQGYQFTYTEDASCRLSSLGFPNNGADYYRYDADSRARSINGDSVIRDARGKVVWTSNGMSSSLRTMRYSPLGNVLELDRSDGSETYTPDALGNNKAVSISGTAGSPWAPETSGDWKKIYDPGRGTLDYSSKVSEEDPHVGDYMPDGYWTWDGDRQIQSMAIGYRHVNFSSGIGGDSLVADTNNTFLSYDGNNRLRRTLSVTRQVYTVNGTSVTDSVRMRSHEYRYDALGRRIMSRYRGPYECRYTNSSDCRATIDWHVWNGSELLFESRAVESELPPDYPNFDGTVVYTQGERLDVPLSIARSSASSPCDFTVSPHADWRGQLTGGSFDGTMPSCANVVWLANNMTAYRRGPAFDATTPWNGSLIDQGSDQSGLQYMRNRYFDPATGQFTQADPIGIAGGLNVYGYANGDPVTFSDPFGLTVCFGGSEEERKSLSNATKRATDTDFSLDANGCAVGVRPRGDSFTPLGERMNEMSEDLTGEWDIQYSLVGPLFTGVGDRSLGYAFVGEGPNSSASLKPYKTGPYGQCDGGEARTTLESLIAHEFFGHVYEGRAGRSTKAEKPAVEAENLYHDLHDGHPRCKW